MYSSVGVVFVIYGEVVKSIASGGFYYFGKPSVLVVEIYRTLVACEVADAVKLSVLGVGILIRLTFRSVISIPYLREKFKVVVNVFFNKSVSVGNFV